ncbi:MAG: phosphotransferase family protein [Candidatus Nanopelagicales bacterium]
MSIPTPGRWTSRDWLDDTLEWGMRAMSRHGLTLRSWSQPHARPWSTALRLETDADPVWLKAPGDGARYEVPLLVLLADLDLPHVPRPLAHDLDRALILLPDGGDVSRIAHGGKTPPDRMAEYLGLYGHLQRLTEPHVESFVAVGVGDLRPARMPALLERTIAVLEHERPPAALSAEDAARLRAVLPAYAEACAELAESGVAPTLQHDDLHDSNILARGPVIIDWGDACVGHPFGTMLATLNSIAFHHTLAPYDPALLRVVDAYTEAWTDLHDRATLRRLVHIAQRVGPLTRSLSYRQALTNVDEPAWQEYGDSMPEWLLEVFEPDLPTRPPLLA